MIPSHYGNVTVSPIGPLDNRYGLSPIEFRLSYVNNLPFAVTIVNRSGLKFTIPTQYSLTNCSLVMRVEITIHPSIRKDIQKVLSKVNEDSTKELRVMKEALALQIERNVHQGGSLYIDYSVTKDNLITLGGSLYYNELDLIISMIPFDEVPEHPYSHEGRLSNLLDRRVTDGAFHYSLKLVDNLNKYGPRYMSVGKKICKINTIKDNALADGVYLVGNSFVTSEIDAVINDVITLSFEQAENEIGLYRTFEEAKNESLDSIAKMKREQTILEHENVKIKLDAQNLKHNQEMMELERQKELQILERERAVHAEEIAAIRARRDSDIADVRARVEHELKLERERVKDFYDDRGYARKDSSEVVKAIPAIVVGLGAIFMAVKAMS